MLCKCCPKTSVPPIPPKALLETLAFSKSATCQYWWEDSVAQDMTSSSYMQGVGSTLLLQCVQEAEAVQLELKACCLGLLL